MSESNPEVSLELQEARAREAALASEAAAKAEADIFAEIEAREARERARLEAVGKVSIGRIVEYRSRTGNYSVPAIVNCTVDSVYRPGVESGNVPALTFADRVHLTVFTPGLPGMRVDADDFVVSSDQPVSENVAGTYQEWNIPFDPDGGPGTWRWPTRV